MKRIISIFLVLLMIFTSIPLLSNEASAAKAPGSNFHERLTAPTMTGWYTNYTNNNCTSYVRWRIAEIFNKDILTITKASDNLVKALVNQGCNKLNYPKAGCVAIWAGHAAIVEKVDNNTNTVWLSEGNYHHNVTNKGDEITNSIRNGYTTLGVSNKTTVNNSCSASGCTGGNWFNIRKTTFNVSTGKLNNGRKDEFKGFYYLLEDTLIYNIETKCDMQLQTAQKNVIVRNGPYKKNSEVDRIDDIGTIVHIVAYTVNSYNHIWYKRADDGNWIYSERLQPVSTYKISYHANGGKNAPSNQTKTKGKDINLSSVYPSKNMCEFVGWSTDPEIKSTYYDVNEAITKVNYQPGATYTANKKLNLYAVWVETKTSLSLSKTVTTLDVDDNKTTTINLEIKGALNSGYTVSVSPSNNVTAKVSSITVSTVSKLGTLANLKFGTGEATVTLTAKSKGNGITVIYIKDNKGKVVATGGISVDVTKKYYITYDANGGTGTPAKQTRVSGKNAYISSTVPTMKNYTFMGWMVAGSEEIKYGPGDIYNLDQNITLVAKWGVNHFTSAIISEDKKVLTIEGHGDMPNYGINNYASSDWNKYASTVERIVFKSANGGAITSIGSYAFADFKKLKEIEVPSTIKRVYSYAFYNCIELESVNAPSGLTLGSYAFANCEKLKNYNNKTAPKKVATTFALNPVDEENGSIGAFAFENCVNLQSIDVSDVAYIGESAFSGCTSLGNIELSDNLTIIEDAAFFNCSNLTEIVLPENLVEIDDGAFSGCSLLTNINLPENLEVLGAEVFSGCSEITDVVIPDSVEEIGEAVFANCTSLEDVVLPEDVICLSDSMFSGCSALQSINIPEDMLDLGKGTFFGCTSLKDINIPENINEIGNNTFAYCESLSKVEIPNSVQNIESFAFFGCSNLENIKLSSQIDKIGSAAFAMCSSLSEISFPASLSEIGESAFAECTALSKIDFEEAVVKINDEAFVGCTALKNVTIPESATYVSSSAFSNCSNDFTVSCYSTSDIYPSINNIAESYNIINPVQGIALDKTTATLKKGETLQLNALFTPSNATNTGVTWSSQDESVASVSNTGLVTALDSGDAVIIATSKEGNFEALFEVNCIVPVESITILNDNDIYYVGNELLIDYELTPANPTNIDIVFSSSDENVVSVSEDGMLAINKPGSAVITITSADGNACNSIIINSKEYIPVNNIFLNSQSVELNPGAIFKLHAEVYPINATGKDIYFYSEDDSIATVNEQGEITAISQGSTSIVCTAGDFEAVCNVIVNDKCIHEYTVTWSVDGKTTSVTYHEGDIIVKPADPIKSGYTFKDWSPAVPEKMPAKDLTFTALFTTPDIKPSVRSVQLNDLEFKYKSSANINPIITADSGAKYTVKWESSNTKVATVDETGKIYAAKRGNATITCIVTDSNGNTVSDTCNIKVKYTFGQWLLIIILFGWIWY